MRRVRNLDAGCGLLLLLLVAAGARADAPLRAYTVPPQTVSVSGFSAGGFMAAQVAVAYSSLFPAGLGVLSGGPFDCARNQSAGACVSNNVPDISLPIAAMRSWSANRIDNVANLAQRKVYLWVGLDDRVTGPNPADLLQQQLLAFLPASNIRYDRLPGVDHTPATPTQDGSVNALTWIYGTLNAPAGSLTGQLVSFDQSAFIGPGNGMDPTGFLYVPATCAAGRACKLHVSFHGCGGNYVLAGIDSYRNSVLNYWADSNDMIVLYPQTTPDTVARTDIRGETFTNSDGCWDFRGLYSADYDQHSGVQVGAIARMVRTIMGSALITAQAGWWWNPAESGRGYSLEPSAATGNVFFAGYMYDGTGSPVWYVATLAPAGGNVFLGTLTQYQGGQSLIGSYRAPTGSSAIGAIQLAFSSPTSAALSITGAGLNPTTIALQRYPIVANGLSNLAGANQPQTGWWWNPAESGRGFFFEVQSNVMFMAGYMYDVNGKPIWYVSQSGLTSNASVSGQLVQYGGGQTLGGVYTQPTVTNGAVGAVSALFASPTAATMVLPNGISIPLQRFGF